MTSTNQIVELSISQEVLVEADRLAKEMGTLNQFSYRGYAGAQVGKVGELMAYQYLDMCGVNYEVIDATTHDVMFVNLDNKYKLEIKTKERTVTPRDDYECSVFSYTKGHQVPDYYLFVSLLAQKGMGDDISRFTKAYIVGSISGSDFDSYCRDLDTAFVDISNNWSPPKDTRNIFIRDLVPPKLSVC